MQHLAVSMMSSSTRSGAQLHLARFADSTRRQYDNGVRHFMDWARANGRKATTAREMDLLMGEFIEHWYVSGRGRQTAVNAFYGFRGHFPEYRGRMPRTLAKLSGWRKLRPSKQHPPLTWPITCAIAMWLVKRGLPRVAVGVLLSFDCLLRIKELSNLRPENVIDGNGDRHERHMRGRVELQLLRTKSGRVQSVEVERKPVRKLVLWLARNTPNGETLIGCSAAVFRYRFKAAVRSLGMDQKFVPHSVRHGGATSLLQRGWRMEDIKRRGRWRWIDSAEHYCQTGRALIMQASVPEAVAAAGKAVADCLLECFRLALPQ